MTGSPELSLLILARDEADVLAGTLRALQQQVAGSCSIHVVADHCRDETAALAARAGARVHLRTGGRPGKGPALDWWLQQVPPPDGRRSWLLVLDADSQLAPQTLEIVRREIARTPEGVYQLGLEPNAAFTEPLMALAAVSEWVEQRVYDRARAALGWPVRLRGTGMLISRNLLETVAGSLRTQIEDAELSLLLVAGGARIRPLREAVVIDPKPADARGAASQRARWLRGQAQLLQAHPGAVVRVLGRGSAGFSLLSSLLAKPRSFAFPLKCILIPLALMLGRAGWGWTGWGAAALLTLSASFEAIAFLAGLAVYRRRAHSDPEPRRLPGYFLLWLRSLGLALISREGWLRTRPAPAERTLRDAGGLPPG